MTTLNDQEFHERMSALERGEDLPADLSAEDAADLALAGRLLALQQEPSPILVSKVEQVVASAAQRKPWWARLLARRKPPQTPRRATVWRRVGWVLATLVLAFTLTMAIFPSARAAVLDLITRISGITFVETEQYPGSGDVDVAGWWSAAFFAEVGEQPEGHELLPEQVVPLSEMPAMLPFSLTLPAWAPEGFVLQEDGHVFLPSEEFDFAQTWARLCWEKTDGDGTIYLHEVYSTEEGFEQTWLVGPGSVEEVPVNGRPAALVRGAWDVKTEQYLDVDLLSLSWTEEGMYYSLTGCGPTISVEDLVRMAESMP